MDRPIPDDMQRRRRLRRAATAVLAAAALLGAMRIVSGLIHPSVRRAHIRTAIVDRGPIEATITARGNVVPEHEQVLTSPIDTRVLAVVKKPGEEVEPGEPILVLDLDEARLALAKLTDQIALERNAREEAELAEEQALAELRGQRAIKELELRSSEYGAERDAKLAERGVASQDDARQSALDADRARIELELLDEAIVNARRALAVKLDKLDLSIAILEKDRDEAERRLERGRVAADRHGVVTWVVPSIGAAVQSGADVARVADLTSFRVDASVSDVHARRLAIGEPVIVRSGDARLDGRIAGILPTVENGIVGFQVALAEPDHPLLRHNLRVDVYVVTARKDSVVRVERGAYVRADGTNAVFVVRDGSAIRTPVAFGITSFERYEVTSGLAPGDEVVVSDMTDFMHLEEVKLR